MIKRIWLTPPLAFARVGGATEACDNFEWAGRDMRAHGSARSTLAPQPTLSVAANGEVSAHHPSSIHFKGEAGFRPVCPFFELHGEWTFEGQSHTGPITAALLSSLGLSLADVQWTVRVANRKAWRYTKAVGDIVQASVRLAGDDTAPHALEGRSPAALPGDPGRPLVPPGQHIPLGSVQLTRPTPAWPGLRLRFTPPAGLAYAPTDLPARLAAVSQVVGTAPDGSPQIPIEKALHDALTQAQQAGTPLPEPLVLALRAMSARLARMNRRWGELGASGVQMVLDPQSAWAQFAWPRPAPLSLAGVLGGLLAGQISLGEGVLHDGDESQLLRQLVPPGTDTGNLPVIVFAFVVEPGKLIASLGVIDDTSDGVIEVQVAGQPHLRAHARVVVTPPSVVPDRRMPVTIADGLADRVARSNVRLAPEAGGLSEAEQDAEVHDLLLRIFETVGLQNVDAVADFVRNENEGLVLTAHAANTTNPASPAKVQADRLLARNKLWPAAPQNTVLAGPLTGVAHQTHRRLATPPYLEALARAWPAWIRRLRPADDLHEPPGAGVPDLKIPPASLYDKRMPTLMRGGDRRPLHLTRRQIELLAAWTMRISAPAPVTAPATAPSALPQDIDEAVPWPAPGQGGPEA